VDADDKDGMSMWQELQPGDPRFIGPYRLRGQLGVGGMGRVFLGASPDERLVAVKVIRADMATSPEFRARFRREVTVARKVSSQFTAQVVLNRIARCCVPNCVGQDAPASLTTLGRDEHVARTTAW
jgi:hypothetical protein